MGVNSAVRGVGVGGKVAMRVISRVGTKSVGFSRSRVGVGVGAAVGRSGGGTVLTAVAVSVGAGGGGGSLVEVRVGRGGGGEGVGVGRMGEFSGVRILAISVACREGISNSVSRAISVMMAGRRAGIRKVWGSVP